MSELPNSLTDQKKETLLANWRPRNFDLFSYVARILRAWPLLLVFTLAGALYGLWEGTREPRLYGSYATFMPPPAELNSTATAGTSLSLLSASLQGDMYLYLLRTRTLTTDVVARTGLAEHLKVSPGVAQYYLFKRSSFDVQRSAVVTVFYRDEDPAFAAKVANAYIDALYRMEGNMVDSAYAHRREFFEKEIKDRRASLEQAEDVFAANQQKLGVLSPEGAAGAEQGQEIGLQAQIDGLDTQLAVLLKSQTEQSPNVIGLRNQQAALRAQLARVKSTGMNPNRGMAGFAGAPEAIVQQNRRGRDIAERNSVYQGLLGRLQLAQSAAADPGPEFEVIDAAIPSPLKEDSQVPKLMIQDGIAGIFAAILALFAWPVMVSNWKQFRLRLKAEAAVRTQEG